MLLSRCRTEKPLAAGDGTTGVVTAGSGPPEALVLKTGTYSEKFGTAPDVHTSPSKADGFVCD